MNVQKPNYGHWICGHFADQKTFEVFDSLATLGGGIDKGLKKIDPAYARVSGQSYPHLLRLIRDTPDVRAIYNTVKVQSDHVNTCGRHAVFRLIMRELNLMQYLDAITGQKLGDPDTIVCCMTGLL